MIRLAHEWLELQAAKSPNEPAVLYGDDILTYEALNRRANQLARRLRALGVTRDQVVAVLLERSTEMIIAVYAILKAGGAYLPLAPSLPAQRLNHIVADSGSSLVLTTKSTIDKQGERLAFELLSIDDEAIYSGPGNDLPAVNEPTDLVYVIYTSGSTGQPKGVMIEHASLINRILWMQEMYPLHTNDVILQKTPFMFDVSVWEIFWWSLEGAKVALMPPGLEKFPQAIIEVASRHRVSVMHFVPSMLNAFLNYAEGSGDTGRLGALRRVFASGEALSFLHVKKFNLLLAPGGACLSNLYGPTEATIDVSYYDCPVEKVEEGTVPIGKAIANTGLVVMDEAGLPLADGEIGELGITGIGVARGYLNKPQLTAERFVLHPSPVGPLRMYKTGDLARVRPDGNIEFHGRMDHQVKIRGLRIELGEIEACLLKFRGIDQSAVIVQEKSENMIHLIAYFVSAEPMEQQDIKRHLKQLLPDYMIPSYYIQLSSLPLSDNGKIDRKALLASMSANTI